MKRTKRLLENMPEFYKTWDEGSVIYKFLFSYGKRLDEFEKELRYVMRSHWIDTAFGSDLDKLASIFNLKRRKGESDKLFRNRIKRAIVEYKGGGTLQAIQYTVRNMFNLPEDYRIKIRENPPVQHNFKIMANAGDTWIIDCMSVEDSELEIEFKVPNNVQKVENPTLEVLETGFTISFKGAIYKNGKLSIKNGKAYLNGVDVSSKIETNGPLILPRGKTTWRFVEAVESKIGFFDKSIFDESIFSIGLNPIEIIFRWVALAPATFEIHVLKEWLGSRRVTLDDLVEVINRVKVAGVKAVIKVV